MLDKRNRLLISKSNEYEVYASVLSEDVYNKSIELISMYGSKMKPSDKKGFVEAMAKELKIEELKDIITLGKTNETSTLTSTFFNKLFSYEYCKFITGVYKSYQCFTFDDWDDDAQRRADPIHRDSKSSWNCLIDRLYKPKFIIIYKLKITN